MRLRDFCADDEPLQVGDEVHCPRASGIPSRASTMGPRRRPLHQTNVASISDIQRPHVANSI
jgi:hypothetical protein